MGSNDIYIIEPDLDFPSLAIGDVSLISDSLLIDPF